MEIRRAERADVSQILSILKELDDIHQKWYPDLYRPLPNGRPPESVLELLARPAWEVWLGLENGVVVGLVAIEFREVKDHLVSRERMYILLDMIVVAEEKRGTGIGRALVEKVKERAKEEGIGEIQLKVVKKNQGAFQWYLDMGFDEMMSLMYLKL